MLSGRYALRLTAESIKQGNTLCVLWIIVCVWVTLLAVVVTHTVFIVLLLIVVLSISLYYLSAYLQLFHLVEDEVLFGECNFCTWKFVVCYYSIISFSCVFLCYSLIDGLGMGYLVSKILVRVDYF